MASEMNDVEAVRELQSLRRMLDGMKEATFAAKDPGMYAAEVAVLNQLNQVMWDRQMEAIDLGIAALRKP